MHKFSTVVSKVLKKQCLLSENVFESVTVSLTSRQEFQDRQTC